MIIRVEGAFRKPFEDLGQTLQDQINANDKRLRQLEREKAAIGRLAGFFWNRGRLDKLTGELGVVQANKKENVAVLDLLPRVDQFDVRRLDRGFQIDAQVHPPTSITLERVQISFGPPVYNPSEMAGRKPTDPIYTVSVAGKKLLEPEATALGIVYKRIVDAVLPLESQPVPEAAPRTAPVLA